MSGSVLRADAARNRGLLVDAAREVLGERGLDAPLDEIAKRAGVGNATLYRRFPSRGELIAAVFAETMRSVVAAIDRALADPDPWRAFADYLTYMCELQAGSRALADLLVARVGRSSELEELRAQAHGGIAALIDRAQAAGVLRADFAREDVVLILMANAGLLRCTRAAAPHAWRRHLSHTLDGLRAAAATPAPPSPGLDAVHAAMDHTAGTLGCGG